MSMPTATPRGTSSPSFPPNSGTGRRIIGRQKAEEVRALIRDRLWVEDEHACFDLDRHGKRNPELIHNNLRVMYYGGFSQEMADAFIRHHLLNPEEFWTSPPIPSIAIDEPLFENVAGNNWSGQVQALTLSRSLYALERYGHYAEISLLGERLVETWVKNDFRFSQQVDPFTGLNSGKTPDGNFTKTSTCLAFLPRMFGIYPVVDQRTNLVVGPAAGRPPISRPANGAARSSLRNVQRRRDRHGNRRREDRFHRQRGSRGS